MINKTETPNSGGYVSVKFKPYPKWHCGLEEWVLVIGPWIGEYVDVRLGGGGKHFAAVDLLLDDEPESTFDPNGEAKEILGSFNAG